MVSRYYVDPSLDATQGLSGLSEVIGQVQEKKRAKEEQMRQQARMEAAQEEIGAAMETGDPMEIARVSLRYPEFQETISQTMGTVDEARSNEQRQFMSSILAQPGNAKEMYERRIDRLESQGRDATHTRQSYQDYLQSPDQELQEMEQLYAMQFPDQYQSFKKATAPADVGAVSGVKTFMDQEGNVVGTFDLSDPEDRAYVIQNNLREAPSRREEGEPGSFTSSQLGKLQIDINEQAAAVNAFGTQAERLLSIMEENEGANTVAASLANIGNRLSNEARALSQEFGVEFEAGQEAFNPERYNDTFEAFGLAGASPRVKNGFLGLAIQRAMAAGLGTGRALSDEDIKQQLETLGRNQSDPKIVRQLFRDSYRNLTDKVRFRAEASEGVSLPEIKEPSFLREDDQAQQEGGQQDIPRIESDEDFQELPSGAEFIDPEGNRRRKP